MDNLPTVVEPSDMALSQAQGDLLLGAADADKVLEAAQHLVGAMEKRCRGPQFVSSISGRNYPKVEWWTAVGSVLGVYPYEESCVETDDGYLAVVQIRRGDQVIGRGSGICTRDEKRWKTADDYAVRSMAITRATGKAYRLCMSYLPVLAGLEPTPAEEMPTDAPVRRPVTRGKLSKIVEHLANPTPAPPAEPGAVNDATDVVHIHKTMSKAGRKGTRYGVEITGGVNLPDGTILGTYDNDLFQVAIDGETGGIPAKIRYTQSGGKYDLVDMELIGVAPASDADQTQVVDDVTETSDELKPEDIPF